MRFALGPVVMLAGLAGLASAASPLSGCGSSDGSGFSGGSVDSGGTGTGTPDATTTPGADDASSGPAVDATSDAQLDASAKPPWPDCKTQPPNTQLLDLPSVWKDLDTGTPNGVFVQNVHVTAIAGGGCKAGYGCQFFVQDGSYATLPLAAHHAIKVFASSTTSKFFTTLAVGDTVDVSGWAWRYNLGGQNELLIEINTILPGCAFKTGTQAVTPVPGVALSDLTVDHYEHTYGPVLITAPYVAGKYTGPANTTFGLFATGDGGSSFDGGSPTDIVSLSPYFLPGGAFTGLTTGAVTKFASVTGVFDIFYAPLGDAGAPTDAGDAGDASASPSNKYLEIGPRTTADIVAM